jgi:hypothetical protein
MSKSRKKAKATAKVAYLLAIKSILPFKDEE